MIYTDILIENKLVDDVIKLSLAKMFELKINDIAIIRKIEDMPLLGKYEIVCYIETTEKGISMFLSIYIFNKKNLERFHLHDFCSFLTKELQTACYLPSDTENPYELLKFTPDGKKVTVYFDADAYDNDGFYLIK